MKFEEYQKAFWAGLAGATTAFMGILVSPPEDWRAGLGLVAGGFGAGFLAAFIPANKINGENVMDQARGKLK